MATLAELIESDVDDVFFNTDEFAETCTYWQGKADISITAIPKMVEYEVVGDEGHLTKVTRTDWSIPAADLTVTPRAGDRIERASGAVYEVVPIDKRPIAETDVSGHVIVVHTKQVARAG